MPKVVWLDCPAIRVAVLVGASWWPLRCCPVPTYSAATWPVARSTTYLTTSVAKHPGQQVVALPQMVTLAQDSR